MVTKGKVVNVRMAPEAHGNIHGFETSNGFPGCIQAGTTPHVMNYLDEFWSLGHPYPWDSIARPP